MQSNGTFKDNHKILITVRWNGEGSNVNAQGIIFGIRRDTTIVGNPDAAGDRKVGMAHGAMGYWNADAGSTPEFVMYQYLDSPSTGSAITYHATLENRNAQTFYHNRSVDDTDNTTHPRLTSTITLQEVVAP